jgi:Zn-dependent peptidase ImmA (M78 family)
MSKRLRCPENVKIGIQNFRIVQLGKQQDALLSDSNYGYTQDTRNIIVIDRDLEETKKRVTVFHELLHACRFVFDNSPPDKKSSYEEWEHHFIGVWENSILLVLQQNPELTEWLLGES